MKQIRRNVFETNSSSTHSISFVCGDLEKNELYIDDDNYIHVSLGEFGWKIKNYYRQDERLSYLVTMVAMLNGFYMWCISKYELEMKIKAFMKTKDFKLISQEIGDYVGCSGVVLDYSEGYIDHQSYEDYGSIYDFIDSTSGSIVNFVFGKTTIHTDNDNH